MTGFANVQALSDRYDAGASVITSFRKQPTVVTASGYWFDMSMSPGNPKPQYYASAPLVSAMLAQSTDGGIFHGAAVSPASMHLHKLLALNVSGAAPCPMMLLDYLLYYPFIDESVVGSEQTTTVGDAIPRYPTGVGVQMLAVIVGAHTGSPVTTFNVRYTNSQGVSNRTSATVTLNQAQFVNGTILASAPAGAGSFAPFVPLQSGDSGVRSVEGVTMQSGGDVGLFTLVLVKPLADLCLRPRTADLLDAPVEIDFFIDRPSMPRVMDDAYLNFLCLPSGSLAAAPFHGMAQFVWST